MKIVYIGNKQLLANGINSVMETLCIEFEQFATVISATHKRTYWGKAYHIITTLFKHSPTADYILVDVFSTKAFYFAVVAAIISKLFEKKYILNLHGGNLPIRYQQSTTLFTYLLKNAYAVTAPSGYLKSYFETKGLIIHLIPNPIQLSEYPLVNLQHAHPEILYLRSFGAIYQPEKLIISMNEIIRKYPQAHLHLFGKDEEGRIPFCKQLIASHKLERNITIHGPQKRTVWMAIAAQCNMCISIPTIDNTPVSILEAMAMGIPVISTNVGGIPYIINDGYNGLLTTGEPKDIALKVDELIKNTELYQQVKEHALKYVQSYDYSQVVEQWKAVLFTDLKHSNL